MAIKGIWVQGAAALINTLLSVGLSLVLARSLGPSSFGNYSVLLNAGIVALVVIEGGYPLLAYRETALTSTALSVWQGRVLALAAGYAVCVALLLALIPVGSWLGQDAIAWWSVVLCMLLVAWMNVYSGFLRGLGRFSSEALWQVAGRCFPMCAILGALAIGKADVSDIFWAWSLGLVLLILLRPQQRPPFPAFELAVPLRTAALHLMYGQLLFVALMRLDLLALAVMGGSPMQTANYTAAARFAEAGLLLFAPVVNLLQLGFRQRFVDKKRFVVFLKLIAVGAFGFALAGTVLGSLIAPQLVSLAFGAEYAEAEPLLVWVLASLIFVLPNQVLVQALIALNRGRSVWIAFAFGLAVTLFTLICLVPIHGALGTAWAMLIGHASVLVASALSLRGCLKNAGETESFRI